MFKKYPDPASQFVPVQHQVFFLTTSTSQFVPGSNPMELHPEHHLSPRQQQHQAVFSSIIGLANSVLQHIVYNGTEYSVPYLLIFILKKFPNKTNDHQKIKTFFLLENCFKGPGEYLFFFFL